MGILIALPRNLLVLVAGLSLFESKAAEQRIDCPAEIPREHIQLARAPTGWTAFVPFEYKPGVPLTSAELMFGPPSRMAISKPDEGSHNVVRWTGLRPEPDGLWMACFYGDNGRQDAILSRRLNDNTKECAVTYATGAKNRTLIDIRCKS